MTVNYLTSGSLIVLSAISAATSGGVQPVANDLVVAAERFCFEPDGDHELTWAIATHDGFVRLSPDSFATLRLPGVRQLRGFSATRGDQEIRVLTAVNRFVSDASSRGSSPGVNFHLCWVSAKPGNRDDVDNALQSLIRIRRFRQDGAFVYAWIPQPDGTRVGVRRSQFNNRFVETARDQGMRMTMTNDADGWVSITYLRPVESCADWCY